MLPFCHVMGSSACPFVSIVKDTNHHKRKYISRKLLSQTHIIDIQWLQMIKCENFWIFFILRDKQSTHHFRDTTLEFRRLCLYRKSIVIVDLLCSGKKILRIILIF